MGRNVIFHSHTVNGKVAPCESIKKDIQLILIEHMLRSHADHVTHGKSANNKTAPIQINFEISHIERWLNWNEIWINVYEFPCVCILEFNHLKDIFHRKLKSTMAFRYIVCCLPNSLCSIHLLRVEWWNRYEFTETSGLKGIRKYVEREITFIWFSQIINLFNVCGCSWFGWSGRH